MYTGISKGSLVAVTYQIQSKYIPREATFTHTTTHSTHILSKSKGEVVPPFNGVGC